MIDRVLTPLITITIVVLAVLLPAQAQQLEKVARIGILSTGSWDDPRRRGAFRDALRELGYVEGHNIVLEYRTSGGKNERVPELANELVRLKPDLIVTSSTTGARAAKDATSTIPIVVSGAGDLVGRGIVASLSRPGGNVTGITAISPELSAKWLELIKEVVPTASRVAFLFRSGEEDELKGVQAAAQALGVRLQPVQIQEAVQLSAAYIAMGKDRAHAAIVTRNPLVNPRRKQVADLAIKNQLPQICEGADFAEDGCLISYAPNREENIRRAAVYVDKILKGAKPADLPVEQPTKFELVINLKTAKEIGLTIPGSVLYRADKVIE